MEENSTLVWFNPACSKCRALKVLLEQRGIGARYRHYLEEAPTAEEIEELLRLLGSEDPMVLIRSKEAVFEELGLPGAGREALIAALCSHPRLLERPVLVRQGRAVVARPPELALPLLD